MRAQLDPPPGVKAALAGQPVLEAEAATSLQASRWVLALLALVAVSLVVVARGRRPGGRAGGRGAARPCDGLGMARGGAGRS